MKTKRSFQSILQFLAISLILGTLIFILSPSQSTLSEQSTPADALVDSIGVAVHLNYRDTAYRDYQNLVKPRLKELGIRHIRDGVKLKDENTQKKFLELAQEGIRSTIVIDPRDQHHPQEAVEIAKKLTTSIEAIEGPNEWDVNPKLKYKNKRFPEAIRRFQAELYQQIKTDPKTKHLPVLSPTMARPQNAAKLGQVSCDIAAMHSYAGGHSPSTDLDKIWIPNATRLCGNSRVIATECGYHNAKFVKKHQPGVSEQAAAKYLTRLFFEYYNRGILRAFTYELIDLKPNSKSDRPTFHYGLLRNDGSRKPDFIALKNLISILQEPQATVRSSTPKALNFTLQGNRQNIHHTLLHKSDGKFYLVLWQEVSSFNQKTQKDLEVNEKPVTVSFKSRFATANIYQPLESAKVLNRVKNPQKIQLKVPDHPLIVELIPA